MEQNNFGDNPKNKVLFLIGGFYLYFTLLYLRHGIGIGCMFLIYLFINKNITLLAFFVLLILVIVRAFYYEQNSYNFHTNRTIYSIDTDDINLKVSFVYFYVFKGCESYVKSNCYIIKTNGGTNKTTLFSGYLLFENDKVKGTIPNGPIASLFINNDLYLKNIEIKDKLPKAYAEKQEIPSIFTHLLPKHWR